MTSRFTKMCVNCHSEMTHRDCVLRPVHVILNLVMSWFLKIFPCGALWMILDGWHHRTPPQFHIFTHPVTESTHVSYPACCIKRNTLWTAKTTAACGFGLIQGTCGQCTRTHQCLVPYPSLRHWIKYPQTSFGLVVGESVHRKCHDHHAFGTSLSAQLFVKRSEA